jgi:hypothetical protein
MATTLSTALLLREAGVSTIPVKPDKRPTIEWRRFMTDTPSVPELNKFFANGTAIALVAGKVQCLDFDEKYSAGIFARFCRRAEEVGLDFLLGELIRQKTPSGGYHLVWRCDGRTIRNLKLAEKPNHECMIETRGDGGYFLIAPSGGYTLENGDWSSIPTISEEDRDALLSLARSFDERPPVESPKADQSLGHDVTPGDDYDFRADIPALLRSHGWKSSGGSEKYWTRPGKNRGISASWDVVPGRLFVFSSSTAFEPNHVYRPWHIYAVLECGADFKRAATELRRQGFGSAPKKKTSVSDWLGDEPPGVEPSPDDPPAVEGVDPMGEAPTTDTEEDKIRRLLRARAFDPTRVPPPVRPVYTLGGVVICTPGNLCAITAQAKVGKSALVSALTAAAMTDPESEADTLSAVGFNAEGKGLLYFDTEQSPDDFWHAVNRAKRRARVDEKPEWLRAYTVADLPAPIARKSILIDMADAAEIHGGIHSVIIDGVADLVLDVNDAEECNSLVAELHSAAIRYDCSIICVIHKNPGSEKVRGHLGSQIERKAETNLSLEKEEELTVIWSNKQRRAPIDKKTGPRFRWDDELKMHVTAEVVDRPAAKVVELLELAEAVLKPGQAMSWKDLIAALQEARSTPDKKPHADTAARWITAMKKAEILVIRFGQYSLNPKINLQPA